MTSYFLSYDIADDRLRRRLDQLLQRHGCKRLQKSVFLAPRYEPPELAALRKDCQQLLRHGAPQDSLLCIPATRQYLSDLLWHGDGATLQHALEEALLVML